MEACEEEGPAKGVEGYKDDASLNSIHGMIVQLWRDGELMASALTDEDGFYRFEGLQPGLYTVREIVPEGWYALEAEEVGLPLPGGEMLQADFVNQRYSSISGNKWNDLNGNGARDAGEGGLAGVLITLKGEGMVREALIAAQGRYRFDHLHSGQYEASEAIPAGWVNTTPAAVEVGLAGGEDLAGVDFLNARVQVGGVVVQPPDRPSFGGDVSQRSPLTGPGQML